MGKMGLTGVSLAAAIPGGILTFLMLMALLNSLEKMPMLLKVVALMLLLVGATMALFPAYILIWYRSGPVVLAKNKKKGKTEAAESLEEAGEEVPEEAGLRDSFLGNFAPAPDAELDDEEIADEEFQTLDEPMEGFADEDFQEEEGFVADTGEDTIVTSEMDRFEGDDDNLESFDEGTDLFSTGLSDDSLPTGELDVFEATADFDSDSSAEALPTGEFESDDLLGGASVDDDFDFEPFDDDEDKKK